MFNESRFFDLARKWKNEGKNSIYFSILESVIINYFNSIVGSSSKHKLIIDGLYQFEDIKFVLDSVGYRSYSILQNEDVLGKTTVLIYGSL